MPRDVLDEDGYLAPSNSDTVYSSSSPTPVIDDTSAKLKQKPRDIFELQELPEVRKVPWREGREPPEDLPPWVQNRYQRVSAILLATRGVVAPKPCRACNGDLGHFTDCIVLKDWFGGSCAHCQYNSAAHKCSRRGMWGGNLQSRAESQHQPKANQAPKRRRLTMSLNHSSHDNQRTNGGSGMDLSTETSPRKLQKRSAATYAKTAITKSIASLNSDFEDEDLYTNIKRRARPRCSLAATSEDESGTMIQQNRGEDDDSDNELIVSSRGRMIRAIIDPDAQRSSSPESEKRIHAKNTQEPNLTGKRAVRAVLSNNVRNQVSSPDSESSPDEDAHDQYSNRALAAHTTSRAKKCTSMQDGRDHRLQLEDTHRTLTKKGNPSRTAQSPAAMSPGIINDASVPLIDALPRAQQKQVYGLLSGIEGCMEHLHKQFMSLQKILGVDLDEQ